MNNTRLALEELGRRLKDVDRFVIAKVRVTTNPQTITMCILSR